MIIYDILYAGGAKPNSSSGGGSSTKYGVSLDGLLGDVDENGVLQAPTEYIDFVGKGIKNVGEGGLENKFYLNQRLRNFSMPDLITLTEKNSMKKACYECDSLLSIDLSNLTTISGSGACDSMFYNCSNVESVNLSNLTTIPGISACNNMFYGCSKLPSIFFPKLQEISKANALNNMFKNCTALTEIHFRADMQATVEALTGYSSKFGASNATIYFDL